MYRLVLIALLIAGLAGPTSLAQSRFSLEFGGEADFATQDLGPSDLGTGMGLELTLGYRILPNLSAYAGWGWHRFAADGFFAGADADAEETGYTFGLFATYPLGRTPYRAFLKAGGVYDHLEFEDADGDIVADTGHGLGWQIGTGLEVPLGRGFDLLPGVQYRMLSRDVEINGVNIETDLSYVAVRVGVRRFL